MGSARAAKGWTRVRRRGMGVVRCDGLRRLRRQLREAYQAAGVIAAFVAFAAILGVAQGEGRAERGVRSGASSPSLALRSTPHLMQRADSAPTLWLIDGFNVLNVAVLRGAERSDFWGPSARERLLELVATRRDAETVVVVFDGPRPLSGEVDGGAAQVVFAADADEWLLRRVREDPEPGRVAVVTADRRLAARARHRGAQVVAPGRFVAECRPGDALPPDSPSESRRADATKPDNETLS